MDENNKSKSFGKRTRNRLNDLDENVELDIEGKIHLLDKLSI